MLAKACGDYAKGPRLLTVRQAADYLGTTAATIYTKIWRREIPFIKLGRSVRLDIHDLDEMIARGRVGPCETTSALRHPEATSHGHF
jgi:excisionase family DNA binding protein